MNFKILIVFFSFFLIADNVWAQDKDKWIKWSAENRLKEENFRQRVPGKETEHRISSRKVRILEGYIYTGIDFNFQRVNKDVTYTIGAFMDPEQSWLRNENDAETLSHEQAHFDITEIYCRMLRRDLAKTKSTDAAKRLYQKTFRELQEEQKRFDADHQSETGLSDKWREKINSQLSELKDWAEHDVEVKLP